MCFEIMAMKGTYQKDIEIASVSKKKWSKSKRRTLLRANLGKATVRANRTLVEKRRRIRAWPARRSHPTTDGVDSAASDRCNRDRSVPSGAMAPRNTTQYLMDVVYAERLGNVNATLSCDVSPDSFDFSRQARDVPVGNIFSLPDTDFDRSLDFQQRDFEDVFFRNEI